MKGLKLSTIVGAIALLAASACADARYAFIYDGKTHQYAPIVGTTLGSFPVTKKLQIECWAFTGTEGTKALVGTALVLPWKLSSTTTIYLGASAETVTNGIPVVSPVAGLALKF